MKNSTRPVLALFSMLAVLGIWHPGPADAGRCAAACNDLTAACLVPVRLDFQNAQDVCLQERFACVDACAAEHGQCLTSCADQLQACELICEDTKSTQFGERRCKRACQADDAICVRSCGRVRDCGPGCRETFHTVCLTEARRELLAGRVVCAGERQSCSDLCGSSVNLRCDKRCGREAVGCYKNVFERLMTCFSACRFSPLGKRGCKRICRADQVVENAVCTDTLLGCYETCLVPPDPTETGGKPGKPGGRDDTGSRPTKPPNPTQPPSPPAETSGGDGVSAGEAGASGSESKAKEAKAAKETGDERRSGESEDGDGRPDAAAKPDKPGG